MKRTLILEEDDLVMIVKSDIVKQLDDHRGEMNRTEFVNYLIQCQLASSSYVTQETITKLTDEISILLRSLINYFATYPSDKAEKTSLCHVLRQQLESLDSLKKP
jgi:hypothetical protein